MATKRSSFDERHDQEVAADPHPRGFSPDQMCSASGCPNRWSVKSGNLCSAHRWADRRDWDQITLEQQQAETERARAASARQPDDDEQILTAQERRALIVRLRSLAAKVSA